MDRERERDIEPLRRIAQAQRVQRSWLAVFVTLSMALSPALAQDEHVDEPGQTDAIEAKTKPEVHALSAGLLVGYGIGPRDSTLLRGTHPWGFGFGVNVGYTLDSGVYLGGEFAYFIGSSESSTQGSGQTMVTETSTASQWSVGVEPGYVVQAGPFQFRPSLELGVVGLDIERVRTTSSGTSRFSGGSHGYVAPGVAALYAPAWATWFVGLDLDLELIADFRPVGGSKSATALLAMANGGARF